MGYHLKLPSLLALRYYNFSTIQRSEDPPWSYKHQSRYLQYLPTYTLLETSSKLHILPHTAMIPTNPLSLLIPLLLQITTTVAHPLTKRKGGGGGGGRSGGGGGTSSLSSSSVSWKTVVAIVVSILGVFLLLYIIYQCCAPGHKLHDWIEKVRDERSAKKRARNEAGDANASANGGRGKAEMGGV